MDDYHSTSMTNSLVRAYSKAVPVTQYGPRVISAVVPRFWKDVQAVHLATRIGYGTLHAWKNGRQQPHLKWVCRIAELTGVDPLELLGADVHTLGRDVSWTDALAKARSLTMMPDWVAVQVSRMPMWLAPGGLTGVLVASLADAVFRNTPPEIQMRHERELAAANIPAIR